MPPPVRTFIRHYGEIAFDITPGDQLLPHACYTDDFAFFYFIRLKDCVPLVADHSLSGCEKGFIPKFGVKTALKEVEILP